MSYFYADAEGAIYDRVVHMTDPHYCQVHDTLTDLLVCWLAVAETVSTLPMGSIIIDIGCGTGAEAIRLLDATKGIRLVGVDSSPTMLQILRDKLVSKYGDATAGGRCDVLCCDVRELGWMDEALRAFHGGASNARCRGVISAYTFHHFAPSKKAEIYREISDHLYPGGAFANADLFSFETKWLGDYSQRLLEDWIRQQFSEPSAPHYSAGDFLGNDRERIPQEWLRHVREENMPIPVMPSRHGNNACITPNEYDLLTGNGFSVVECAYRAGQDSILWAKKE